ncbi:hypothetical protein EVG20_g9974 [Dentipellis fragilis]|uniref:Uncharacterized protein n=1 Tax=Dentipellis fragilis TaxID=205917 RepID=A0A4Y9XUE7_9AGAM|nr:hypothetical protein EVG20_g9974 [Dentipellis fragilis]
MVANPLASEIVTPAVGLLEGDAPHHDRDIPEQATSQAEQAPPVHTSQGPDHIGALAFEESAPFPPTHATSIQYRDDRHPTPCLDRPRTGYERAGAGSIFSFSVIGHWPCADIPVVQGRHGERHGSMDKNEKDDPSCDAILDIAASHTRLPDAIDSQCTLGRPVRGSVPDYHKAKTAKVLLKGLEAVLGLTDTQVACHVDREEEISNWSPESTPKDTGRPTRKTQSTPGFFPYWTRTSFKRP